jgi:uncharacterized protein YecT (DUF1311 family)
MVLVILYGVWTLTQPETESFIPSPPVNTVSPMTDDPAVTPPTQNAQEFDAIPDALPQLDDGDEAVSDNRALDGEVVSTNKQSGEIQNNLNAEDGEEAPDNSLPEPGELGDNQAAGQTDNQSDVSANEATATPPARTKPRPASRITLIATQDSWIEIRDNEGDRILARTLEPGDEYRVPAQDNLRLLTGNAGGVKVAVDGDEIGRLGRSAEVIRNLELTPDSLRSAVIRSNSRPPR